MHTCKQAYVKIFLSRPSHRPSSQGFIDTVEFWSRDMCMCACKKRWNSRSGLSLTLMLSSTWNPWPTNNSLTRVSALFFWTTVGISLSWSMMDVMRQGSKSEGRSPWPSCYRRGVWSSVSSYFVSKGTGTLDGIDVLVWFGIFICLLPCCGRRGTRKNIILKIQLMASCCTSQAAAFHAGKEFLHHGDTEGQPRDCFVAHSRVTRLHVQAPKMSF